MSCQSSALYYGFINDESARRLGGNHNVRSLMATVDFGEIAELQRQGEWDRLGEMMACAARQLERGGADCVLICANTMHKVADHVTNAVKIPLIHIADETADAIRRTGQSRAGLLGTKFTMEDPFYSDRLQRHGVSVVTPPQPSRDEIHRIIYEELTRGIIREASRERYIQFIRDLAKQGAECVILGCTEIGMIIDEKNSPLPVHDSMAIHALAAVNFALN